MSAVRKLKSCAADVSGPIKLIAVSYAGKSKKATPAAFDS
jgi:hypothetical protein